MRIKILLFLLLIPVLVSAESTINCHCFQDRSFDHANTAAADPYFLATTQNSFLSHVYGIEKRTIVKAKMTGTDGNHLWILFDVARRSQRDTRQIESLYAQSGNWPMTLKLLQLSDKQLDETYQKLSKNPEALADHIVDLHLTTYFDVSPEELTAWHTLGMSRKELILAILLGDPEKVYNQVQQGKKTWGELLYAQGLLDGTAIAQRLKEKMAQG